MKKKSRLQLNPSMNLRNRDRFLRILILFMISSLLILNVSPINAASRPSNTAGQEYSAYLPLVSKPLKEVPPGLFNITLLAQVGGSSKAISVSGDYAFIGVGARLEVLDITELTSPIMIGQSGILADAIRNLDVSGNYVYAAAGLDGGLIVLDITDPKKPVQGGNFNTECVAEDVDVVANFAYVACATRGLMIFDVSNPTSPALRGIYDTQNLAESVFVKDNLAYVADYYDGLKIIDVSNPRRPVLVGSYLTTAATDVHVTDKIAYVSDAMSGLYIINVNNPASPTLLGRYTIGWTEYYYNVKVFNQIAYVADQNDGLRIIDVSQPTSPKLLGVFYAGRDTLRVDIIGDVAFVADRNSGVYTIDVSDPKNPTAMSLYSTGTIEDVSVIGDNGYFATGKGLEIYDLSNLANPVWMTSDKTTGPCWSVRAKGNFVFVICSYKEPPVEGGLRIIDVQNPNTLKLIGTYNMYDSYFSEINLGIKLAYLVHRNYTGGGGIKIIDINDPSNPSFMGSIETINNADRASIWGNNAFITAWDGGLKIVDIQDPTNPKLLGSHKTQSYARDVSVMNHKAYVSDYYGGLEIIDVADPSLPKLINTYEETCQLSEGVKVVDNLAYMVTAGSLQIIDVTNPETANLRGSFPIPGNYSSSGFSRKIEVINDIIYVASGQEGLFILNVTPPIQ